MNAKRSKRTLYILLAAVIALGLVLTLLHIIVSADDPDPAENPLSVASVTVQPWQEGETLDGEAQVLAGSPATVGSSAVEANVHDSFESGDQIKVYGWTGDGSSIPAKQPISSVNTLQADGTFVADTKMQWQGRAEKHWFIGVYPVRNVTNFEADPFVLATENPKSADLLVATTDEEGVTAEAGDVSLTFDHVMARLKINLYFRSQFRTNAPNVERVVVYAGNEATVSYLTKGVSAEAYAFDQDKYIVAAKTQAEAYFDAGYCAVMVPQAGVRRIAVVIDGVTYTFENNDDIPLESGKETTVNLNVGKDEIKGFHTAVNAWKQGETLDGEAQVLAGSPTTVGSSTMEANVHDSFEVGDQIKLYGWTGRAIPDPSDTPIVSTGTLTEGGTWDMVPQVLWQSQTAAHYFLSVYPNQEVGDFRTDRFSLDGNPKTSDLLVAVSDDQGIVANNRDIDLTFDHVMARLKINLTFSGKTGTQSPVVDRVVLYAGRDATVDYMRKLVTADAYVFDEKQYIVIPQTQTATGFDACYSSVMVPQSGVRRIDIVIGGVTYTYESNEDISLASGKETTVNLNVDVSDVASSSSTRTFDGNVLTLDKLPIFKDGDIQVCLPVKKRTFF